MPHELTCARCGDTDGPFAIDDQVLCEPCATQPSSRPTA